MTSPVGGIQFALAGLQKSLAHFDDTARRIVRDAPGGDFASDLVELRLDSASVSAQAAVVRTGDELLGEILDMLA